MEDCLVLFICVCRVGNSLFLPRSAVMKPRVFISHEINFLIEPCDRFDPCVSVTCLSLAHVVKPVKLPRLPRISAASSILSSQPVFGLQTVSTYYEIPPVDCVVNIEYRYRVFTYRVCSRTEYRVGTGTLSNRKVHPCSHDDVLL
jgi:hypothetical protein